MRYQKNFRDVFLKEQLCQQKRNKPASGLTINDMILFKDDSLARLQCKLG